MTSSSRTTCISAPGKVLVAGGYLVLDQRYDGLVLATSSRFYTVVRNTSTSTGADRDSGSGASDDADAAVDGADGRNGECEARITVTAAQFPSGSSWSYLVSLRSKHDPSTDTAPGSKDNSTNGAGSQASQHSSYTGPSMHIRQTVSPKSNRQAESGRNKFIEVTLAKVLQLAWEVKLRRMRRGGDGGEAAEGEGRGEGEGKGEGGVEGASEEEWVRAGREVIMDISGSVREGEKAERGGAIKGGLEVFVLADNDFYSQRESLSKLNLPPTISSLRSLPPFNPLPRAIGETNKTGLGSSAALVTSLTAGLLQHLGVVRLGATSAATTATAAASESPAGVKGETAHNVNGTYEADTNTDTDTIHALAQLAHCTAQGKVGSGFDVSSAVYGSHVYKRFDPACIAGLMEVDHLPIRPLPLLASQSSTLPSPSPFARLTAARSLDQSLARKAWDHQALPFRLPPGLRLVLADVDAGTDTPSFVGKVLKFGRDNPGEKERLYGDVERANGGVRGAVEGLERVSEGEGYEAALEAWVGGQGEREGAGVQGGVVKEALDTLAKQLESVRSALRALGDAAGVPIEPVEQTRLLDASCKIPGVIGGGVPGAGGYDALFVIIVDRPEPLAQLQTLWAGWTELQVSPLLAMQSDGGLRVEDVRAVRGLREALERCDGGL